jgi:hypothetical protein
MDGIADARLPAIRVAPAMDPVIAGMVFALVPVMVFTVPAMDPVMAGIASDEVPMMETIPLIDPVITGMAEELVPTTFCTPAMDPVIAGIEEDEVPVVLVALKEIMTFPPEELADMLIESWIAPDPLCT